MQYGDVRKVIKSFEGTHIPTEFARREAIARAEHYKQVGAKKGKAPGGGLGWIGSHLGLKPSNMSLMVAPEGEENPQEAFAKGKMLQDLTRERGMRGYLHLEQNIRENGEKWLKEEQEMLEKANQEAMKTMQSSLFDWFRSKPSEEKKDDNPVVPTATPSAPEKKA
jgi:mitochondrial import inner membrane translocase subunit TIM50